MQDTSDYARALAEVDRTGSCQRERRHKREAQKTRDKALLLLAADHRVEYRGTDHTSTAIAAQLGFNPHDLIIWRVLVAHRLATLIIAPGRVWYSRDNRSLLLDVKRRIRALGGQVILMPAGQINKQPRLDNAKLLAASAHVSLTATERMNVEMYVLMQGGASLSECANQISSNPDPVGAVLNLVHARRFDVCLNRPISPYTVVRPASALEAHP